MYTLSIKMTAFLHDGDYIFEKREKVQKAFSLFIAENEYQ